MKDTANMNDSTSKLDTATRLRRETQNILDLVVSGRHLISPYADKTAYEYIDEAATQLMELIAYLHTLDAGADVWHLLEPEDRTWTCLCCCIDGKHDGSSHLLRHEIVGRLNELERLARPERNRLRDAGSERADDEWLRMYAELNPIDQESIRRKVREWHFITRPSPDTDHE